MTPRPSCDIGELIDRGFSPLQLRVVLLCALVALLDGIDTQSIGVAAPSLAAKLGLPLPAIGPVLSAALFGAMFGAMAFGPLADMLGRKRLLCLATAGFGVFTLLTAWADSYWTLIACRFLAGMGLGGAVPCFVALTSEYVPAHRRAMVVGVQYAVFPLGGMVGGFLSAFLLRHYDWEMIFIVGGTLPLIVALILLVALPESVRFLLTRCGSTKAVEAIMQRIAPEAARIGAVYTSREPRLPGASVKHLFAAGRARTTMGLWVPFFMGFGMFAIAVLWAPALLRRDGLSPADTAFAVAFNGLGAFLGSMAVGRLMERSSPAVALIPCFLLGALATASLGMVGTSATFAAVNMLVHGLALGAGTTGMIAFAALIYPTAIRSTGVGWAMAAGRMGQAVAPLIAAGLLLIGWQVWAIFLAIGLGPLLAIPFIARIGRDGGGPQAGISRPARAPAPEHGP